MCREALSAGLSAAAQAWKERHPGARTLGCFPVYSPHELFHAAGVMPFGLLGAGASVEITHADSRFQSFVCSIAKSSLELGLQDRLGGVDGAVFHSICDVARNLASVFRRNFPDRFVEFIHFPQNMISAASLEYAVSEYRRVLANLGRWTGREIPDGALLESIRLYNRIRGRIRDLYALRRRHPERLTAAELYLLVRGGTLMDPAEFLSLLDEALPEAEARTSKARDAVRVVIEGAFCEQPPVELLEVIERAGCYVVDDDLLIGWRWFDGDVPETGDPVEALASSYLHRSVYSSVRHDPRRPRSAELVRRVREAGADAVLFCPAKFCEPALLDYVLHRQALDRESIPHLTVEFEEKMWTFDRVRNEVETFVESILFE
ncbi:MAG TPA: 2-hydroxyacyl-CoA dehydratase [Planctomycetota bacterium]|nr:2-hydroxyacyl-CoA dehydratase [Planctomycetota bacterium]